MPLGPIESILAARIARRYYLLDQSKSEIAVDLDVSRFRVARLLAAARRDGLVTIEISAPGQVDTALSDELQQAYSLRHSLVLDAPGEDPMALRDGLGAIGADLLREISTSADVLGMAWARSLEGMAAHLSQMAPCPVVQLTGAFPGADGSDVLDLVRRVAEAGGGTPHVYYSPLVAPDAASARMVRRQPDVARAMDMVQQVTVAVVGLGAWAPGLSTVYDSVEPQARKKAASAGTIGEISGALIAADGSPVSSPLSRRIIGISPEQLDRIATVISIAHGAGKEHAIAAALRGGLVNGLITTASMAKSLLALQSETGTPPRDAAHTTGVRSPP